MLALYHLGSLHPVEQALTILLAFGPFIVLGLVIVIRRRQDRQEELRESQQGGSNGHQGDQRDR